MLRHKAYPWRIMDEKALIVKRLNDLASLILKPQSHSLKLQSIRAAVWSLLEKGSSHALRMLGSLILTRILFPEAFGIMAAAQTVILMIQLFTDTGVKTAIIQNPKGAEREFLDSVFLISTVRGLFLSLIVAGIALPMALYYRQPQLTGILLILAINPFLLGFESPSLTVLIKQFRVEKKVALEIGSQVLGLITSIILAYIYRSVYALAIGSVFSSLYRVAGSFLVSPYSPRFRWNREIATEIFHFGKFIMLNTLISFTAMNADVLITGKVLNMVDLGVYNIGRTMGLLIWIVCLQIFLQSYLPAVSSVLNDLPRIVKIYRNTTSFILALTIPVSMIFALFSRDIIGILYDPRYLEASTAMFWFSISGILLVLNAINSSTFIAMGRLKYETISMGICLVCVFLLVPTGAKQYGLAGAAVGMLIAISIMVTAQTFFLSSGLGFPASKVVRPWVQVVVVSGAISLVYYALRPLLSSTSLYNIPFIAVMSTLALSASMFLHILWNGSRQAGEQAVG